MKQYYEDYPSFIEDLNQKENTLRYKLQSLEEAILNQDNTVNLEMQIPDILIKFKDIVDNLDEAYLPKNAQKNIDKKIMVQRQKEIQIQKGHYEELNKKFQDIVIKRYGTLEQNMKAKSELENDKTLIDFIEDFYLDINLLNSKIKKINVKINNVTIKYDIQLNEKKK